MTRRAILMLSFLAIACSSGDNNDDDGDPTQGVPGVPAVVAGVPHALDEPAVLVEPNRRDGDPSARGDLPDGQQVVLVHPRSLRLDLKQA